MRDILLYVHIILGILLVIVSIVILRNKNQKGPTLKLLSGLATAISWILLVPAGELYITFYPATKTLIQAGGWPWAHSIIMETKEHWGLLLPIITTVAAWLVYNGKVKESRKWWMLVIAVAVLIAVLGRVVKIGAGMQ